MPFAVASVLAVIWVLGFITALSIGGVGHVLIVSGLIFFVFVCSTQRKPV